MHFAFIIVYIRFKIVAKLVHEKNEIAGVLSSLSTHVVYYSIIFTNDSTRTWHLYIYIDWGLNPRHY